jgi:hypothetical protein
MQPRVDRREIAAIFAGGAIGTLARAALAEAVVTIVIDTPERIARAQEVIDELTSERGLVTCETITCLAEGRAAGSGVMGAGPPWR